MSTWTLLVDGHFLLVHGHLTTDATQGLTGACLFRSRDLSITHSLSHTLSLSHSHTLSLSHSLTLPLSHSYALTLLLSRFCGCGRRRVPASGTSWNGTAFKPCLYCEWLLSRRKLTSLYRETRRINFRPLHLEQMNSYSHFQARKEHLKTFNVFYLEAKARIWP